MSAFVGNRCSHLQRRKRDPRPLPTPQLLDGTTWPGQKPSVPAEENFSGLIQNRQRYFLSYGDTQLLDCRKHVLSDSVTDFQLSLTSSSQAVTWSYRDLQSRSYTSGRFCWKHYFHMLGPTDRRVLCEHYNLRKRSTRDHCVKRDDNFSEQRARRSSSIKCCRERSSIHCVLPLDRFSSPSPSDSS